MYLIHADRSSLRTATPPLVWELIGPRLLENTRNGEPTPDPDPAWAWPDLWPLVLQARCQGSSRTPNHPKISEMSPPGRSLSFRDRPFRDRKTTVSPRPINCLTVHRPLRLRFIPTHCAREFFVEIEAFGAHIWDIVRHVPGPFRTRNSFWSKQLLLGWQSVPGPYWTRNSFWFKQSLLGCDIIRCSK